PLRAVSSALGQHVLDEVPEITRFTALSDARQRTVGGIATQLLQERRFTPFHPRTLTSSHRNTPPSDLGTAGRVSGNPQPRQALSSSYESLGRLIGPACPRRLTPVQAEPNRCTTHIDLTRGSAIGTACSHASI